MSKEKKQPIVKPTIKLRVYRGSEINYDAKGNVRNENQLVTLQHNTVEWRTYLKNIKLHGYCDIKVDSIYVNGEKVTDGSEVYEKEVHDAFKGKIEVKLTPEQKKIAELEAKLEAFMSGNKTKEDPKKDSNTDDLSKARDKYKELFGKPPHHKAKLEKILSDIAEKEAN